MSRIAAILPAAGMGTRMGAETPKQFLELDGTPIVILSLRRIAAVRGCDIGNSGDGHGQRSEAGQLAGGCGANYGHSAARARGAGADAASVFDKAFERSVCACRD